MGPGAQADELGYIGFILDGDSGLFQAGSLRQCPLTGYM